MKPEEFDELVRRKIDRGDFSYDPGQWSRLEERMNGEPKKRRVVIWWMPLLGVAAAVSISLGYSSYMKHAVDVMRLQAPVALKTAVHTTHPGSTPVRNMATNTLVMPHPAAVQQPAGNVAADTEPKAEPRIDRSLLINKDNPLKTAPKALVLQAGPLPVQIDLLQADAEREKAKKRVATAEAPKTASAALRHPNANSLKSSLLLAAGVGYGAGTNSYTFGATGRRMLNNRVFVESDIAFVAGSNTQKTATAVSSAPEYASGKMGATARTSSGPVNGDDAAGGLPNVVVSDKSYNAYYAQISPSLGYKIHRKLSVAVGPDFQQALQDNRPAPATLDKHNVEVDPLFDLGLVGKTELTVSGNLKAALIYRSGINNIVTPMDKYIDRNYFQFQVRYAIFNKMK